MIAFCKKFSCRDLTKGVDIPIFNDGMGRVMFIVLRDLPWYIAVSLVLVFSVFLSMVLTTIIRKIQWRYAGAINKEIHVKIIDMSGLMLAFLMGFAVLMSQNWYDAAGEALESESNHIRNALRDASFSDPISKAKIQNALNDYIHYLNQEWTLLEKGEKDKNNSMEPYIKKIEETYYSLPVDTFSKQQMYTNALANLDIINNKRVTIEKLASASFHPVIWAFLLFFSLLLIGFVSTFPIENAMYNYLTNFIYILIVCMLLLLIHLLEFPFSGDINVKSAALETMLQQ